MRTIAVVQARMGSTRLPGKVLMDIAGRPMVEHVLERAAAIPGVAEAVLATSTNPEDDALAERCRAWRVHRGPAEDVLTRFAGAARAARAEAVVRITADCPLLCPEISGLVVARLHAGGCDYASNVVRRTYPRGLDTEALPMAVLERAEREATAQRDREHVTIFVWSQPQRFRVAGVEDAVDRSTWRWTVDTQPDLDLARVLHAELPRGFGYAAACALLAQRPELAGINAGIEQKPVQQA
jgi:spore coat polysaccharide biosynthesis protein SpsF (cytidylyltransferase family)